MKHSAYTQKKFPETTVVITGASSGAGRAMAIELAKKGTKLLLVARREDALKEVVKQCNEIGGMALGMPADVTDADTIKQVASVAKEFGGSVDVWINNAGVLAAGAFDETPIEVHHQVINTNLIGYLNGAHAVLPYFKQQGYGLLINNISVGGWIPVPYSVGYSSSKYGLCGFSEALRAELITWPQIKICDLFPAFLDTPGIQHAANYTGKVLVPAPPVYDPQQLAKAVVSVIEAPRKSVTFGAVAPLLKFSNAIAPSITRLVASKVIEGYLKQAEPTAYTSGNVFKAVDFGTGIHGGWNKPSTGINKKVLAGFFLGALAAGFVWVTNKKVSL